jgi:undecaprenyl pyrophosphate phosphatase UppP
MEFKNKPAGKKKSNTWIALIIIWSLMLFGLISTRNLSNLENNYTIIVALLFIIGGISLYFKEKFKK